MARTVTEVYEEPVRGGFADISILGLNGLERMRAAVRGLWPPPPIHHLTGLRPIEAGPGARQPSPPPKIPMDEPIRIAISACLVGQPVRYDGGHKRAPVVVESVPDVEWVPVCPEVEIGMGTPREPIRLVDDESGPRLVGIDSGIDHTEAMRAFAARRIAQLEHLGISGYVLKARSPSCGPDAVPIHGSSGIPVRAGPGVFADELLRRWADLPVADETRLNDPNAMRAFVARAEAYRARRTQIASDGDRSRP